MCVRELLLRGANPNAGFPMHVAAQFDNVDCVRELIASGAAVSSGVPCPLTCLSLQLGLSQLTRRALDLALHSPLCAFAAVGSRPARPNTTSPSRRGRGIPLASSPTAVRAAGRRGVVARPCRAIAIDACSCGWTPPCSGGTAQEVTRCRHCRRAIERRSNGAAPSSNRGVVGVSHPRHCPAWFMVESVWRLLMLRCQCRCVRLLLAANASVDHVDGNNETALHKAAAQGGDGCVKLLLRSGANFDLANAKGGTPLHLAAKHGHVAAALCLLKRWPVVSGKRGRSCALARMPH